jgi:hypothetical protein
MTGDLEQKPSVPALVKESASGRSLDRETT